MVASIEVVSGDVRNTACDVLILKYAQGFYGADLAVALALDLRSNRVGLGPGEHLLLPTANVKCIYYKNITHLRKQLVQCMLRLLAEA